MSVTATKSTIYLFTTTRVGLYKRDLLNVCCFQRDWQIEFGYTEAYVPPKLHADPKANLLDHPATIVFCEPVKEGDVYYKYHPVRRGTIRAARKDSAGSLTLSIELGDVFDYYAGDANGRVARFQDFVNESEDRPRTLVSERFTKKNLFLRAGETHFSEDSWQPWKDSWHALVNYLGKRKGLDDSLFVRFAPEPTEGDEGRGRPLPQPVRDGTGRPQWRVKSGGTYEVRFELRAGGMADQRPPEITTREDLATVLGPFERQSGEGTEVDFLVVPKRVFQTEYGTAVVRVAPVGNGKERSSEFAGILEVRPSRWLLPVTLGSLVIGSALMSLDLKLLEGWFGVAGAAHPYWNGPVALAVAKLAGGFFIGLGGYLGFRKFPMKG